MLKQHSQVINFMMGLCDLIVLATAWALAYFIRFRFFHYEDLPTPRTVFMYLVLAQLVSLIVLNGAGLYKPRRDKSFLIELGQIIKATMIIWVLLIVFIYYTANTPFTRGMLALVLPFTMAGLILERGAYRSVLRKLRRRGWNLRYALIVGTGRLAQSTLLRLRHNSWTGIRVAGFIDTYNAAAPDPAELPHAVRGVPVVGSVGTIIETIDRMKVDCVFLALPTQQNELLRTLTSQLEETSVDIRIIPDLFLSRFPTNVAVDELDGLPILSLRENPLAGWPSIYKRAFDIFGALFGLILFSLPMLAIAIMIKLHDRGPIFYKQCRISYGRRSFSMLKFRTMILNSEPDGPAFTNKNDPRCTPLGKHLRAFSLDELPQLFNVLLGDMSLVGPRPERPEMLDKIRHEVPGFPLRLKVRAGITGWAQVNGYRGQTSFRKRLQYDLYYLNNWSPLFDLRIVLATLIRGFRHPNAF